MTFYNKKLTLLVLSGFCCFLGAKITNFIPGLPNLLNEHQQVKNQNFNQIPKNKVFFTSYGSEKNNLWRNLYLTIFLTPFQYNYWAQVIVQHKTSIQPGWYFFKYFAGDGSGPLLLFFWKNFKTEINQELTRKSEVLGLNKDYLFQVLKQAFLNNVWFAFFTQVFLTLIQDTYTFKKEESCCYQDFRRNGIVLKLPFADVRKSKIPRDNVWSVGFDILLFPKTSLIVNETIIIDYFQFLINFSFAPPFKFNITFPVIRVKKTESPLVIKNYEDSILKKLYFYMNVAKPQAKFIKIAPESDDIKIPNPGTKATTFFVDFYQFLPDGRSKVYTFKKFLIKSFS